MIATALLPLMFITPAADDPTPVDSTLVEAILGTGEVDELCGAYGEMITTFDGLGLDYAAMQTFTDMADAYVIVMMEGDSLWLQPDGREALTDWLHSDCS